MWLWQHLLYKHSHSPRGPGQAGEIEIRMAGVSPCTKKKQNMKLQMFQECQASGQSLESLLIWRSVHAAHCGRDREGHKVIIESMLFFLHVQQLASLCWSGNGVLLQQTSIS